MITLVEPGFDLRFLCTPVHEWVSRVLSDISDLLCACDTPAEFVDSTGPNAVCVQHAVMLHTVLCLIESLLSRDCAERVQEFVKACRADIEHSMTLVLNRPQQ